MAKFEWKSIALPQSRSPFSTKNRSPLAPKPIALFSLDRTFPQKNDRTSTKSDRHHKRHLIAPLSENDRSSPLCDRTSTKSDRPLLKADLPKYPKNIDV